VLLRCPTGLKIRLCVVIGVWRLGIRFGCRSWCTRLGRSGWGLFVVGGRIVGCGECWRGWVGCFVVGCSSCVFGGCDG